MTGTWTPLVNPIPAATPGTMDLLNNGTVMVTGNTGENWFNLTPDSSGSYINGTWSQLASMSTLRLYPTNGTLQDGRFFMLGGQYISPPYTSANTNTGEIYDPVANTWTAMANFPESTFGNASATVLANGTVLAGSRNGPNTYVYDPATDNWSAGPTHVDAGRSGAPWIELRDGSILTYRSLNGPHSELLDPTTNTWVDAGVVPVSLWDGTHSIGPATLLPDGRVFHLGSNNNTAIYTPSVTPGGMGTWEAGPTLPSGYQCNISSLAMLPNGHVLFVAGQYTDAPVHVLEFDPTAPIESSLTDVTPSGLSASQPFVSRMVMLPTGQALAILPGASNLLVYTPDGTANASWKPTITDVSASGVNQFTLTGTQLNGISNGAMSIGGGGGASNYPIVQLTNPAGNVFYARTSHWSTSQVATGATPVTTEFTLPEWVHSGNYSLRVIANGIASDAVPFTVTGTKFFVADDAATDRTYRYAADGAARGNAALASADSAPRGVASTAAGDKYWVVDANRKVYVYSAGGALLGSWTAGTLANNATPEGIATNGVDVWIVDSKSDKVFRYTGAATRLSGSQSAASSFNLNSGNSNPKDVVTDGQSLWVVDDAASTDKVFKYSTAGSLLGSWTIDSANKSPTGITIDPLNVSNIWIVDNGADKVYQYTAAATRTSGSQAAAATFALAAGNSNPQGIADPPAAEERALQEVLDEAFGQGVSASTRAIQHAERPHVEVRASDYVFGSWFSSSESTKPKRAKSPQPAS